jgi:hypothetical protein
MSHDEAALYHSNGYNAQAAGGHCDGIIHHQRWCQTLNPVVGYAYKIVVSANKLINWRSETRLSDYPPLARRPVGPLPRLNSMLRLALNRLS